MLGLLELIRQRDRRSVHAPSALSEAYPPPSRLLSPSTPDPTILNMDSEQQMDDCPTHLFILIVRMIPITIRLIQAPHHALPPPSNRGRRPSLADPSTGAHDGGVTGEPSFLRVGRVVVILWTRVEGEQRKKRSVSVLRASDTSRAADAHR